MSNEPEFRSDTEWLQLAPPVGLVVSALTLKRGRASSPRARPRSTPLRRASSIAEDSDSPTLPDPLELLRDRARLAGRRCRRRPR